MRKLKLLLFAAVALTLGAISANASITVYVQADSNPYLYVWDSANQDLNGGWPGTQMTETAEVRGVTFFKATFDATSINIILSNGNGNQTSDIEGITEDVYYSYDGNTTATVYQFPAETHDYTVTFVNGLNWENVYAYAWTGEGSATIPFTSNWPGAKINKTGTTTIDGVVFDVYTCTISATEAPAKIIFNNGGNEQTGDLDFVADKQYEWYPIDMKNHINNWDFTGCSNNNFPGWTIYAPNGGNTWKHGDTAVEYWIGTAANGSFDYYQTISNLPVGKYTIQASMWNSSNGVNGDAPNGNAGVYGTSFGKTVFKGVTTDCADNALVTETTDEIKVIDGTLRLGVKNNGPMGARWFGVDWIKLTVTGAVGLSDYLEFLNEAVSTAQDTEGTIPTAAYNAIAAVISQYNQEYNNGDNYLTAINAIKDAVSTYASDDIVAAYARYNRIRTAVLAINSDLDVSAADAAANAATTNAGVDAAVPTLRNVLTTYLAGVVSEDIDVTDALIDNPAPGISGNLDWWTTNQPTGYGNNLYEFYSKTDASSRQTIPATMPVGYYKMTVVGYTREGQNALMFVDAGTENVAGQTLVGVASTTVNNLSQGNGWIAAGNGVNEMVFNLENAAENNFTIGIWGGDQGDRWTAWRSFKLEFLGTEPVFILKQQLADAIAAARTTVSGLAVPQGVKDTFEGVASGIENAMNSYTTAAEVADALQVIEDAVETAKEAIAPTAENPFVLGKANLAITELTGLSDNDKATLQGVIDDNANALAACADAAAVVAQNNALWAAIGTAINSISLSGTDKLDLTFLLTNPNVDQFYTGNHNVHVDGWYTEQSDGNFQVVPGEGCANADGIHKHAYEFWSYNAKANDKFTLYQKLNLPEGTYSIDCWAFAKQQDGETGKTPIEGIYFYANDTQGDVVSNYPLDKKNISFVNDAQMEVKIGLKALASGNTYNWMGIGYMELYKVPAQSFVVDENVAWDNTVAGAGTVTLNRTIKAGVNTLVLPFSMTQAEVEDNFGAESKVYVLSEYEDAKDNLKFTTHSGISANLPCLLKATKAGTSYTLDDRIIVAGTPETTVTGAKMIGTYAATINAPEGSYIINGGKIYNVNSTVALKNTRAYIQLTTEGAARALTLTFDDGETTGIATLENGQLNIENGVIYDLSGRVVKNPGKGVYVINGKKVVK